MAVVFVDTCDLLGLNCHVCPVSRNTLQILQAFAHFLVPTTCLYILVHVEGSTWVMSL